MKYRIQIQQVFGGNWSNMKEAREHAEWLQKDNIKPRNRIQGLAALVEQANVYKNGAPHRLVAIQPNGEFRVIDTITRGPAFFPASVGSAVGAITRANAVIDGPDARKAATKKSKAEISAYFEGGLAYSDSKGAACNPHPAEDLENAAWLSGWSDAYEFDNRIPAE